MTDSSEKDKLILVSSYIITPLLPAILLVTNEQSTTPDYRRHVVQSFVLGVLAMGVKFLPIFNWVAALIIWGYSVVLGVRYAMGKKDEIPFLTNFGRQQGWF